MCSREVLLRSVHIARIYTVVLVIGLAAVEYGDYIYFYSPCGLSDCGTSAGVVST